MTFWGKYLTFDKSCIRGSFYYDGELLWHSNTRRSGESRDKLGNLRRHKEIASI